MKLHENVTMGINLYRGPKKFILLMIVLSLTFSIYEYYKTLQFALKQPSDIVNGIFLTLEPIEENKIKKWQDLRNNMGNLSRLGEILLKDTPTPKSSSGNYKILVWKYGSTIESRHLKHFTGELIDPFSYCSVKNCDISYKDEDLDTADIVIFHLHRIKGLKDIPKRTNTKQIWAFLTDESPHHTFLSSKDALEAFNGIFNWSMTYRIDSDIPVPYGRTLLKRNPEFDMKLILNKRRDVLVAIMGSNCHGHNHRWKYVKELQKYIAVDVYGGCGPMKNACPGHFKADCPAIDQYLFYLSFENSNCDEYITEKLWWNAFHKNSIPIVMGSTLQTYEKLLPPGSYINVDNFANPAGLADYLLQLNKTGDFKHYYNWKANFEVLNEHGYFRSKSYHYCRICQSLNYNIKEPKIYNNLQKFWSVKESCHEAWDDWHD
ncbi:glycoprotein 3-alpha-L-fucosyltransferase A-like isoform X2 [Rhynchophorus ferrugineus]|uniref:glycoprotein 3-alpha-L-fucosyltransferase A-like isoform X2 n=1 Tax=Rhynchophorus ferrugineus TaxID=354439 RepID=UPI003FCCAF0D